jgi:hypothetical protein
MRYVVVALAGIALYSVWQEVSMRPVRWPAGVLAAADPQQSEPDNADPLDHGDFHLTPRAAFTAEVRVLARERYRLGALAEASPLDLAVGWGPMSDTAVLDQLEIGQANRFYFWHYDGEEPPIPRAEIETHSANWHLIPESDAVWKTLKRIRVGDVVQLEGELVDVERPDVGVMRTSVSRDDTGAGACEVVLVRSAAVRDH